MKTLVEKSFFALIQTQSAVVSINSPSELVKWAKANQQPLPSVIVIGDTPLDEGAVLTDPEFVVMSQMFMGGGYDFPSQSMVNPLYLVGDKKRVDAHLDALRLALIGPSTAEYSGFGKHKYAKSLIAEARHMALKNSNGSVHPVTEFCRPVYFNDNGVAQIQELELTVQHKSKDTYVITDESGPNLFQLKKREPWVPSWEIPKLHGVENPCGSRVSVIGCDSPFGPNGTTTLLFELQGRKVLHDSCAYSSHVLRANGILPSDIDVIQVSHIHADHATDFFPYATNSKKKIEIWATEEITYCLIKKLKALWNMSEKRVTRYFRWQTIKVGTPKNLHGYRFEFHYGVHPIPAIGVTLSHRGEHMLTHTGDTGFANLLDGFLKADVITKTRYDEIINLPKKGLTFADAGMAMIHGTPDDLKVHDAANLMVYHTSALPEDFQKELNLLKPGYVYDFESGNASAHDTALITQILKNMGVRNCEAWAATLQSESTVERRPAGQLLVQKASTNADAVFFITHGIVNVEIDDTVVASLGTCEYFGEQAIFQPATKRARNASIRSQSVTRLLRIPANIFIEMINEDTRIARENKCDQESAFSRFQRVWANRTIISSIPQFSGLSATQINDLSVKLEKLPDLDVGARFIKEGSSDDNAYIVASGTVEVWKDNVPGFRPIRLSHPCLVGENVSLGLEERRNASIMTVEHCDIYRISGDDFRALHDQVPLVRANIERTAQARGVTLDDDAAA